MKRFSIQGLDRELDINCTVVNMDTGKVIENVLTIVINDEASRCGNGGKLVLWDLERQSAGGNIATKEQSFKSMYAIRGGSSNKIALIHCYGAK